MRQSATGIRPVVGGAPGFADLEPPGGLTRERSLNLAVLERLETGNDLVAQGSESGRGAGLPVGEIVGHCNAPKDGFILW